MAISIDWATKIITVPKADTTLDDIGPPEIRSLDVDQFRKDLNALQASENGMWAETTHVHTAPVTLGGVSYARQVEIINGYTVTFEAGAYAVNLGGVNNNISDVTNYNNVQTRSANSAGLQIVSVGSGLSVAQDASLTAIENQVINIEGAFDLSDLMKLVSAAAAGDVTPPPSYPGQLTIQDVNGTKTRITATVTEDGQRTVTATDVT